MNFVMKSSNTTPKSLIEMTNYNPYVATLVEMGYDVADCQMVASAGVKDTYPREIHGRIFNTEAEYKVALADFINGL